MRWIMRLALIPVVVAAIALPLSADEWRWHNIAWDGFAVASVISPPGSSEVVYASLIYRWPMEDEGVYKSYDGGLTWRYLPESHNPSCDVLTIDPKNLAIVYCGSWVGMFFDPEDYPKRSHDAGEHWEALSDPMDRMVPSPWTEGLIIAVSHAGAGWSLWKSSDDAETWRYLSGSEINYMTDNVIFHSEDSLLVFAGYIPHDGPDGLARSRDEGDTWEVVLEGNICSFDQDPANSSHWIAMKAYDDVYSEPAYFAESYDNGSTWELWPLPEPIHIAREMLFDLFDSQTIYMANSCPHSLGVYRSMSGGYTWEPMNEGFDTVSVVRIFRRTHRPGELFAATGTGLWLWTDEQSAPDPGDVTVGELRLEGVGPCPFRDWVRARMVVGGSGVVQAQVYSINGGALSTLLERSVESGTYALSWDGRDNGGREVAPGAYLLRIQAGEERAIRRVVKVE